jgi:anti-anti-sigma factor
MDIRKTLQGPAAVLSLSGPLVDEQIGPLDAAIGACVDEGRLHILLELSHVPFVDSAGLEKLVSAASDLGHRGGNLCIAGLNETCNDILLATRLYSLIQVFPDIDSSLGNLL